MALRQHGPRKLSNLEKAAIDLVFEAYPKLGVGSGTIFDLLTISLLPASDPVDRGSYGGNHIKIGIDSHQCADDLDYYSALSNTDILKPGNMDYLNTFIHEATHHWQLYNDKYRWRGVFGEEPYDFTQKELTESPPSEHKAKTDSNPWYKQSKKLDSLDLLKEQHASAAATWFVIAWQLRYTLDTVDLIDLTTTSYNRPVRHSVGTLDRYHEIQEMEPGEDGRWVSRGMARSLAHDFRKVIKELRDGRIFL